MTSRQQFIYALYEYCRKQEKCGARIGAIIDSLPSSLPIDGYEPFAGHSPSVPPIGGDD